MRLAAIMLAFLTLPAAAEDDLSEALKAQIVPCWNVGSLADVEDYIWMFVSLDLREDGRFEPEDIKWQEARGGAPKEASRMFVSVHRAIERCGADGFDLPKARYNDWRESNLVFVLNGKPSQ